MDGENEKIKFPVVFKECPKCGCEQKLVDTATDQLIAEGSLPKGWGSSTPEYASGIVQRIPLLDPSHLPAIIGVKPSVKGLEIFMDICVKCGTLYCTHFNIIDIPFEIPGMQQMPGIKPFGQN